MKFSIRLIGSTILFFNTSFALAQELKTSVPEALLYKTNITIDGKLNDWNDSLHYLYEKQGLQFEVANDDKNMYVAMRVIDAASQMQALHQGFSFTVNKEGKKKEGAILAFPIPDRESLKSLMARDNEQRPEDLRLGLLKAVRAIYVKGLTDVVDGSVSLNNDYGIYTAIIIDSADALCYEAAIPFARLAINPDDVQELAINVKINGTVMRTVTDWNGPINSRYGRYGYPYGYSGNRPTRKELDKEKGLWFVLPLAKP